MSQINSPDDSISNVTSLIPDELRKEFSDEDIALVHEMAQRQELSTGEILKVQHIRDQLKRINADLENRKRTALSKDAVREYEKVAMLQKRWETGRAIAIYRKELAENVELLSQQIQ